MSGQEPQQPYGQGYGQQPYGQGYGQQPYGQGGQPYQLPYQQGEPRKTNTMAILALVFAFVIAPLGVVFGFVARSQIKRTGEAGSGLALAGIIVGLVVVLLYVLAIVLFGVLAGAAGSTVISDFPSPAPSSTF